MQSATPSLGEHADMLISFTLQRCWLLCKVFLEARSRFILMTTISRRYRSEPPFLQRRELRLDKVKEHLFKVMTAGTWSCEDSRTGLCDFETSTVQCLPPLHEINPLLSLRIFNRCATSRCLHHSWEPDPPCLDSV